jgi:hypothetical protein
MIDELFLINCSTLFLLQPLGLNKQQLDGYGFVNAFLEDGGNENVYEGTVLFLLFKPRSLEKFKYFVDTEKVRTPGFVDEYDYEGGYVVLVYELPLEYHADYELFKQGKYSQFSDKLKKAYPKERSFGGSGPLPTIQWMIVNKYPEWKQIVETSLLIEPPLDAAAELWQAPNMEKERLIIENLKNLV